MQTVKNVSPAARRHLVADLLRTQIISSQEELVHALAGRGIVVTQTTASRDLEHLGCRWTWRGRRAPGAAGGLSARSAHFLTRPGAHAASRARH